MIISPWNSTVLRQHKVDAIVSELAFAKASRELIPHHPKVFMVSPLSKKVPAFVSPITSVEYESRKLSESGAVFLDGRSFMRAEARSDTGTVVVNNMQDELFTRLGVLTAMWVEDSSIREDFMRTGDIAAQAYIAWISHSIANKLGLDLEVSRELQIITGVFYSHLFLDAEDAVSVKGKERVERLIQRWTRHPIDIIQGIVQAMPYMSMLADYIKAVQEHFAHNTRVSQINVGFLVTTLGRSWFGYGAQEIAAVSLEYPPMYLALIEAACNTKVWRKTHLGQLVDRLKTGKQTEEFVRSMEVLAGRADGKYR